MKKLLWLLFSLGLIAGFFTVARNAWQTAAYFQTHGRTGTVKVESRHNASRWSEPLPLKKIHAYVAILAPDHRLVLESDQNLEVDREYFVRFLARDTAAVASDLSLRPLINILKRNTGATSARDADPAVPFMFAGAKDGTLEVIWKNSAMAERILAGLWLLAIMMTALQTWVTPWNSHRLVGAERKDFVHPTMRRIDPDAPDAPTPRIKYAPKPAVKRQPAITPSEPPSGPAAGS